MRAGSGCAAHQTLSAEAASVLKQSLSLSRRRGHAHVTPLHVAATLLSSRASPLRRACLNSQPPQHHTHLSHHPLQCRALELCFNVALNRLPATPAPLLSVQPSLSNALVAALKRAQAHQRRGCIEQQQQQPPPLIAIKVELEQLILSILDDPSVSRVMREAGFSSAAVKSNLEDSSMNSVFQCYNNTSGGIYSTPNSPPPETQNYHAARGGFWQSHLLSCASEQNPLLFSPKKRPNCDFASLSEDVKLVMEVLLRNKKRKNSTVIVGDTLSMAESVVAEIMEKIERGDVPEELKSANLVKFQFSSMGLRFMKREEVELNIGDLKRKVDSFASVGGGGVIIYTGDLKWTVEIDYDDDDKDYGISVYRPVDHLILEIGKLLSWYNNSNNNGIRVWLMGTANYQTYMKCQMKQPPLDVHWALQAVSVPSGGLGFSLNTTSYQDSRMNSVKTPLSRDFEKKPSLFVHDEQEVLTCCRECKSNYENEANFKSSIQLRSLSLQSDNNRTENGSPNLPFWLKQHHMEKQLVQDDLVQLRRKYNKLCVSIHKGSHNSVINNPFYLGRDYNYPSSHNPVSINKNSIFAYSETISFADYPPVKTNPTASSLPRFRRQRSCHIDFSFGNNGSSENPTVEPNLDSLKGLDDKEVEITLALGNLTHDDRAPSSEGHASCNNNDNENLVKLIQENVLWQSESTIAKIVDVVLASDSEANEGKKIILIKGNDVIGKRRFAVGVAKFVFGSSDSMLRVNMRKDAWDREIMEKALREHEKLVVLVEDVDYADFEFVNFLNEGCEREARHAIFILTMEDEEKYSYDFSKENDEPVIRMKMVVIDGSEPTILDRKRKADWDYPTTDGKSRRNDEADQVSANSLDLNIKVDDHDEVRRGNKPNSLRFLEKIENCYVFDRDLDREARAKEMFLSNLKKASDEVRGIRDNLSGFSVDERVLEEILRGSGLYLNGLFERWVTEVFETSLLLGLDSGVGERVRVRLCLEGEGCKEEEDGFMGTCLPKSILISFIG